GGTSRLPPLLQPVPAHRRHGRSLPTRRGRDHAVRLPRGLPVLRAQAPQRRRLAAPGTRRPL
ncbi:MAG: hypothetical protein AVDCRST_MAG10-1185, partial [uncultured Acidimicrobiales bacterium]